MKKIFEGENRYDQRKEKILSRKVKGILKDWVSIEIGYPTKIRDFSIPMRHRD